METTAFQNTTSSTDVATTEAFPQYVGYIATVITCLAFGSFFAPVKKFDAADGVFFQWIQCIAIMAFGVVFNIIIGAPKFEPLAMFGGVMWCTGNLVCVIVVRCIGLGIGMNLWSLVGLILGWASGRFGFFETPDVPTLEWLQYMGIALSIVRGIISAFIKSDISENPQSTPTIAVQSGNTTASTSGIAGSIRLTSVARKMSELLQRRGSEVKSSRPYEELDETGTEVKAEGNGDGLHSVNATVTIESGATGAKSDDFIGSLSPSQKKCLGIGLATFAGINFGFQFATVSVRKSQGGSQRDMEYAFAFYCGSFIASCTYMMIYAMVKRNKPVVNVQLIAPGFLSGALWALGQTGWFIANESLNEAITFPLMSAGPALVTLMWAYFVFHEIKGKTNVILLVIVVVLTIASVLMVALSM